MRYFHTYNNALSCRMHADGLLFPLKLSYNNRILILNRSILFDAVKILTSAIELLIHVF